MLKKQDAARPPHIALFYQLSIWLSALFGRLCSDWTRLLPPCVSGSCVRLFSLPYSH